MNFGPRLIFRSFMMMLSIYSWCGNA